MRAIVENFKERLREAASEEEREARRIGLELKFPLVDLKGKAATEEDVTALWRFLQQQGWTLVRDPLTGGVVGAKKPGAQNDTVASCETGFCTAELSVAHVADLWELERVVRELRREFVTFSGLHGSLFLGYGIQPKTAPSARLVIKKERTTFWEKVFASNRVVPGQESDGADLFTVNASTHVHVDVSEEEAIRAVNVLNGFAGAQIALTADSNIWRGTPDPRYKCVCEKFWDWWLPGSDRVGMPARPFRGIGDYVKTIAGFKPVYVEREGKAIGLTGWDSFAEYYQEEGEVVGEDANGHKVKVTPSFRDFDLHRTFCWHTARISRYFTAENRVNDQQPPDEMLCVAALTLGLVEALPEAVEELSAWEWRVLRKARSTACENGLDEPDDGIGLDVLAGRMLAIAERGLRRRGLSEEEFLGPLENRLRRRQCPADSALRHFKEGGLEALISARQL